jgi:hypothetical protein
MRDRIIRIIEKTTTPHRRYKELEEWTGISAESWRKVTTGKQRPTAEMLQGIARHFPQYSEWLLTGDIKANRQMNPDPPPCPPNPPGFIDLSLLDEPYTPTGDELKDELKLSAEEIENMVNAFFSQVAKRKRKKNGDQKS